MIPPATIRQLFDYNWWARDRQLEACAGLAEEQFLRPLGSSFSSLRDTLAHLVAVEWLYLERWRGRPPRSLPPAGDFPTLEAVRARWSEIEAGLRCRFSDLSDDALAAPITYATMKGDSRTLALWQMLYHLLNHQSYHRGQVTTQLRQVGARPAAVDFYVYLETQQ